MRYALLKEDGVCIDSNECAETNYNYILDEEGNKCANECDNDKYFYIKQNFCSNSCDESIYIIKNKTCGLCKDYYPDKPYKLINVSNRRGNSRRS